MGKRGLEPLRLAAHDPKSCSSASSDTSPDRKSANIVAFCLTFILFKSGWVYNLADLNRSKRSYEREIQLLPNVWHRP